MFSQMLLPVVKQHAQHYAQRKAGDKAVPAQVNGTK